MMPILSAREMQEQDIPLITNYWLQADKDFLLGMGAEIEKIPPRGHWETMLHKQLTESYEEKKSYATIWQADGKAIGHCNLFPIAYGNEAGMHLHIWDAAHRRLGYGAQLVQLSLPLFFRNLKLKTIYSEPYALNNAPNKTLQKAGFTFVKEYVTIPGSLSFEQPANRWQFTSEQFITM